MNKSNRFAVASPILLSLALVAGCSSSDSTTTTPGTDSGTPGTTADSGSTGAKDSGSGTTPGTDSGAAADSSTGTGADAAPATGPCTEAGAVCMTLNAASLTGTPDRLLVGFYKALPPAGPPDVNGGTITAPPIKAGTPYDAKLTGVTAKGDYFVYAVLYMPGGGQFQPKKGVDYVTQTAAAITFDPTKPTTIASLPPLTLAQ